MYDRVPGRYDLVPLGICYRDLHHIEVLPMNTTEAQLRKRIAYERLKRLIAEQRTQQWRVVALIESLLILLLITWLRGLLSS